MLARFRAFKWHFPGKLNFFPQNIEIKVIFFWRNEDLASPLQLSITERVQRTNRTIDHLKNYLLHRVVQNLIKLTQG